MKIIKVVLFLVVLAAFLVAPLNLWAAANLAEEAVEYRIRGYQAQVNGDLETAITYYQKAIALDSSYAAPYNDLGVAYESKGWLDKAERAYLKALQIDPNYINVYSNLALLCEKKKEIEKAVFYWKKRVQLGDPNDVWTQKAWEKLNQYAPSQKYYRRADSLFQKGRYEEALEEIDKALNIAPEDTDIISLKKKIVIKFNEEQIAAHFAQGMKHYHSGDYLNAGEEFREMLKFLPGED